MESKDMERHLLSHSKFQCLFCQKTMKNAASFTYHEKVSCPILHGYRCLNCQTIFQTDKELVQHRATHITRDNKCIEKTKDDHRFACHLCDSSFARKSILEDHVIVVHKKIKRFHCEKCGQSFLHRSSHNRHAEKCGQPPAMNKMVTAFPEADQTFPEADQTFPGADETFPDADETFSEADKTFSEADHSLADADQKLTETEQIF